MPMQDIGPENFEGMVRENEKPVAVDFYTDWCGPCKMLEPRLAQLAKDYEGKATVLSMDAEKAGSLAQQLNIRSVPTVVFFKGGSECERLVGLVPYEKLAEHLDDLLSE